MKTYSYIALALLLLSQVQCLPMLSSSKLEWIPDLMDDVLIDEYQSSSQFQSLFNSADSTSDEDEELLVDNAHAQSQMAKIYPFVTAIEDPYADDLMAFDTDKNDPIAKDMNAFVAAEYDVIPQRHRDQSKKSSAGVLRISRGLKLKPQQRSDMISRVFSPLEQQGRSPNILSNIQKYLDQDFLNKDSDKNLKDVPGDESVSSFLQPDFKNMDIDLDDLLYSAQSQDFQHSTKYSSAERGELQRSQSSNDLSKVAASKQEPIKEQDLYANEVLSDFKSVDDEDNVEPNQQRGVGEVTSSYRRRAI
ncbi:hypothetical protein MP228_005246 [Amoeboaphelidium protococcarum]|nr:hypothetical protein MP228_005246 [Amoeboaphelidium protococcarum]